MNLPDMLEPLILTYLRYNNGWNRNKINEWLISIKND